jgi:hypothetical protein
VIASAAVAVLAVGTALPVAISGLHQSYAAVDSSRERIYPQVGPSLYDALRRDDLASWVAAHPSYVLK